MIAAQIHPAHVNQTFTGCGFAAGALAATGGEQTHVNALVSPTGTPGEVLISTGVSSSQGTPARVSCDTAVRMMLDMGAHAASLANWAAKLFSGLTLATRRVNWMMP